MVRWMDLATSRLATSCCIYKDYGTDSDSTICPARSMDYRLWPVVNAIIESKRFGGTNMTKRLAEVILLLGFIGIGTTLGLTFLSTECFHQCFESPDAQRIFYWHVPQHQYFIALDSFSQVPHCGFSSVPTSAGKCMLQVQAGLATGLMTVWVVWFGVQQSGASQDWTDVRLNTFGLLTFLAMFLVLVGKAQIDGGKQCLHALVCLVSPFQSRTLLHGYVNSPSRSSDWRWGKWKLNGEMALFSFGYDLIHSFHLRPCPDEHANHIPRATIGKDSRSKG